MGSNGQELELDWTSAAPAVASHSKCPLDLVPLDSTRSKRTDQGEWLEHRHGKLGEETIIHLISFDSNSNLTSSQAIVGHHSGAQARLGQQIGAHETIGPVQWAWIVWRDEDVGSVRMIAIHGHGLIVC